jgi:hypothetical protein
MIPDEYRVMFQVEDTLWWYKGMEAISRAILERYYTRTMVGLMVTRSFLISGDYGIQACNLPDCGIN